MRGRGTKRISSQNQWYTQVVAAASGQLSERVSWEILLRTLDLPGQHEYSLSPSYVHFRAKLFLGAAALPYLLRQSFAFLLHSLGPALGRTLAKQICGECCAQTIGRERPLLFSLHLVHYCPELSAAELSSLEALVQHLPAGVQAVMRKEDRWENFQLAVSCSVTGSRGISTSLFWVAEAENTCHTFYGSNLLDGGAL